LTIFIVKNGQTSPDFMTAQTAPEAKKYRSEAESVVADVLQGNSAGR
jgi:hypothetical protein